MHRDRIKLWEEFNTAWISALQRQKELTMEMLDTGQRPHHPQSLLESVQMEGMGKELVRLCDIMEKHGLVDYQMGVWEEEIITRKYRFAHSDTVTDTDLSQSLIRAWICSKNKAKIPVRQLRLHHLRNNAEDNLCRFETFLLSNLTNIPGWCFALSSLRSDLFSCILRDISYHFH